ncbi:MAG TPA: HAMP domain-containing sensor histidine kinase [Caulobacteraceae bacterium]|nr:HAMP domain-containing sensor histidine kinase [Caulobacteraceae bacterium]
MAPTDTPAPAPAPPSDPGALAAALLWSAAWSGVVVVALAALAGFGLLTLPVGLALAVGAAPGLLAQLLRLRDGSRERMALIGLWALAAAAAVSLAGGLAGPLGPWCAAPLAAAIALDRRRLVSAGAALSLMALAASLWAAVTGSAPAATLELWPWLSSLSLVTLIGGLAWALPLSMRRPLEPAERGADARRLEELLAGQPHLVITLDALGKLGSAFGAAPPGVPIDDLFAHGLIASAWHPDRAALQNAILRAATRGEADAGFAPRTAPDRWVELALRRLPDGRLAGILRDATVQHAREVSLEAARAEAEALNARKSRFLANMSHELRTPLNAVIGFSDIMKQRLFGPMPDRYLEYARLIHESGGHLLAVINDVLDMSKIEAERYELSRTVFDAREPISAAMRLVRLQAHEAGVALQSVLPQEPVAVEADERAVKQITLNLLSNALKFTPAGGSVTVSLATEARTLELTVSDTGVGIAPEDVERLGRPYEQAGDAGSRSLGTGLGLSLVRAFAELHGGTMAIESTLGEGAAITVRLPVVLQEQAAGGQPRGAEIIPLNVGR